MQCPNCKEKYRFQDVPFQYRYMKFLVTEFICPFCEVWITPGKAFKGMLKTFILLTLASIIFIILGKYYNPTFMWVGIGLCFFSFLFLILSKIVLKYEVKQNISSKMERILNQISSSPQNTYYYSPLDYKYGKTVRFSKSYIIEFIFFFLFYFAFGYFILGMNSNKTLIFHVSLLLFAAIYSFVCTEIFTRKYYGFYAHQIIAIPILIFSIILNFHLLNLTT